MVKFTWPMDKIQFQRGILVCISSAIAYGILNGYIGYYNKVSEYMRSVAYREAQEAIKEYRVKLMKSNQQLFSSDQSGFPDDSGLRWKRTDTRT